MALCLNLGYHSGTERFFFLALPQLVCQSADNHKLINIGPDGDHSPISKNLQTPFLGKS